MFASSFLVKKICLYIFCIFKNNILFWKIFLDTGSEEHFIFLSFLNLFSFFPEGKKSLGERFPQLLQAPAFSYFVNFVEEEKLNYPEKKK